MPPDEFRRASSCTWAHRVQPMGPKGGPRSRVITAKVRTYGRAIHLPKCATAAKRYIFDPADRGASQQ
jgi:hypothetical protein